MAIVHVCRLYVRPCLCACVRPGVASPHSTLELHSLWLWNISHVHSAANPGGTWCTRGLAFAAYMRPAPASRTLQYTSSCEICMKFVWAVVHTLQVLKPLQHQGTL
jgi:hypothetical protein